MRETPIIFIPLLVPPTLADFKTQTRREVNRLAGFGPVTEFQRSETPGYHWQFRDSRQRWNDIDHRRLIQCSPYGAGGDRLWLRENGWQRPARTMEMLREGADTWPRYEYDADDCDHEQLRAQGWKCRPSIHMPRWASRITLEITGLHVERLQDISEADCIAEGCPGGPGSILGHRHDASPREQFQHIWTSTGGNWRANPWVWVIEFRRLEEGAGNVQSR